jgi:hypothetical protein
MNEPAALGMVLAMLVDPSGKPARGGSVKGQLYASKERLVVLRPTAGQETFRRAAGVALLASVVLVMANLFVWKSMVALWIAVALQAGYWLSLPARRRALEPEPLTAGKLDAAVRAGRALVQLPAEAIVRTTAPEPPRAGFRKPARFELPDGALEVYLSAEQFRSAVEALGAAVATRMDRDTP